MHSNDAGHSGSSGQILEHETQISGFLGSELEIVRLANSDDLSSRPYQRLRRWQICPVLGDGAPCNRHRIFEKRESQRQRGSDVNQPDAMEAFCLHLDDWGTRAVQGNARPGGSSCGSRLTQNPGSVGLGLIAFVPAPVR